MSDQSSSPDRLTSGPISDEAVDAIVADVYLADGGPPDETQIEDMRRQFRALHGTSELLVAEPNFDTKARDEATYIRDRLEEARIRLYLTRWDRRAGLVLASATVLIALCSQFNIITLSAKTMQTMVMGLIGVLIGAGVFESGRLGFLARMNWNHIDDLGASLPAFVVRGHHKVHEAQRMMLQRAQTGAAPRNVMVVELWNRQRVAGTNQSWSVEREIDNLVKSYPGCRVRSAVSATPKTWPQRAELLQRRCDKVEQRFFFENPLQVDVILTDDEAILTFPRGNGDSGIAVVFRSKGITKELWEVFESQVGARSKAESIPITSSDDIDKVKTWVHTDARPVGVFPQSLTGT